MEEFKKNGIEAFIFADLLEINDEGWQNAVEGWLNTQRFNVLVSEKDFQKALEIYNSVSENIHSVGLPDIIKMKSSEITPGSLAEVVRSESPLARRYVAAVLGDVIMTVIENLRNYKKSITKDCMKYSGYTASRISPEIYTRWYIGRQARKKRENFLADQIKNNLNILSGLREEKIIIEHDLEILKRAIESLNEMKQLENSHVNIERLNTEKIEKQKVIDEIDQSEFSVIEIKIQNISSEIKILESEQNNINREIGSLEGQITGLKNSLNFYMDEKTRSGNIFEEQMAFFIELFDEFNIYYKERTENKNFISVKNNFEKNKKGNETRYENIRDSLDKIKNQFNHENNLYLEVDYKNHLPFFNLLSKYEKTELPAYLEKISHARLEAEKQFKEHFVTKLNEYIDDARNNFQEINSTLKDIKFGKDRYKFIIEEKQENKNILSVIKSAAKITDDAGTLWEHLGDENEKAEVNRLFSSILENDLDSAEVKRLCDYREYFQYDIRIIHTDMITDAGKTEESSLSRVLREKSGGETQTPYYVAIAASFFRFFKDDEFAIRLVLFDEAFNKMDDDRIDKMIDFFKKTGIQIVTAVPTEKIEPIAPFMDRVNIIIRNRNLAYVRDYSILRDSVFNEQ